MGIRFVTPETITLPLSDGDSIVIKKRLTHGERDATYALMRSAPQDKRSAELVGYLVRWSSPTPYSLEMSEQERIDVLNSLDADSFDEIQSAVKAHVEATEQEKKLQSGNGSFVQTLPSAAAMAGAMTT